MQPDTLIPDPSNPQAWNRYSYVLNNPIRYNDPTGHKACEDVDAFGRCLTENDISKAAKKKNDDRDSDNPCNKGDNFLECTIKRVKSGPDYISLNVPIPIFYGLAGFDILITRDHYNNWYLGGGVAGATPGFDIGFGWFLSDKRNEHRLEKILAGPSFTVSGGNFVGLGGNNTDPSIAHLDNHQTRPEDFAVEPELTTPGGAAVFTYSLLLYDNGNPNPWFPGILK